MSEGYKDPNLIDTNLESNCPDCGQKTLMSLKNKDPNRFVDGDKKSLVYCTQCNFEEDGRDFDKRLIGI